MFRKIRFWQAGVAVAAVLSPMTGFHPKLVNPATLLEAGKVAPAVVQSVTVKDGVVSGEVLNKSSRLLRDVQLLIRYVWLWKDEMRPGKDDPGMAVYYTLEKEIPPGGKAPFTYRPASALPSRPDGYFEVSVSVAGFTEIIR